MKNTSRTKSTGVSVKAKAPQPRHIITNKIQHSDWLLYCRPGFEQDCAQEALRQAKQQKPIIATEQPAIIANSGYVVVTLNEQSLNYRELIFTRQLMRLHHSIPTLSERDRLTPILDVVTTLPDTFGTLWLEAPDTNDGKLLATFTRRFQPLLETALREQGRLQDDPRATRLHIFFPDKNSVLIGTSDPHNSTDAIMGIVRQSMPAEAPSRSTMKLAEAIEVFMDRSTRRLDLATGQARHPCDRSRQWRNERHAYQPPAGATSQTGRLQICTAQSSGLASVRHGGKTFQSRNVNRGMVRGRLVQTRDF
jgi:hypothetical protein